MKQMPITCRGHTRPVRDLSFSGITESGYLLLSASKDYTAMLHEGDTGDWVGTFVGHKGALWAAKLSRDALIAATGSADFCSKVWDSTNGGELRSYDHHGIVKSVDLCPNDGKTLLTGTSVGTVNIFDITSDREEPLMEIEHHRKAVKKCQYAGDNLIAVASVDNTIRFWDTRVDPVASIIEIEVTPAASDMKCFDDRAVVAHGDEIAFIDIGSRSVSSTFKAPCTLNAVAVHPSEDVLVCGGEDFAVYKYSFAGEQREHFKCHFGAIHCLSYSPDGQVYASGSEDGTIRMYQHVIGTRYGLWKVIPAENDSDVNEG